MERISAAENITIEMSDDHWRMIANGQVEPQVLLEAETGKSVHYLVDFAATRRLPHGGTLALEEIQRVVLGWSPGDEAWHLGLLLEAELARVRGSRWCEIASWPDPSTHVFHDVAARAGEALAQVTTRPFYLVPPKEAAQAAPAPERPLPELPLELDEEWTLERAGDGLLQFTRAPRVSRLFLRRMLWYGFWAIIFFVLVYLTLSSGIAPSNPAFLPYLGLFSGLVLVYLSIRYLYLYLTSPNHIVIDAAARQVRGQRGSRVRWSHRISEIRSVYVSQVVGQRKGKRAVSYAELNLHLATGEFFFLLNADQVDLVSSETGDADEPQPKAEFVSSLDANSVTTNLQAAALHVGQALDIPVWYDRRPA